MCRWRHIAVDEHRLKPDNENSIDYCLLLLLSVAFAFGGIASVVAIFLVAAWLVLTFISHALTSGGGRSGRSSGGSSSDDDGSSIELPSGRKVSGTFAGDDFNANNGKTYKRSGWGSSDWEAKN